MKICWLLFHFAFKEYTFSKFVNLGTWSMCVLWEHFVAKMTNSFSTPPLRSVGIFHSSLDVFLGMMCYLAMLKFWTSPLPFNIMSWFPNNQMPLYSSSICKLSRTVLTHVMLERNAGRLLITFPFLVEGITNLIFSSVSLPIHDHSSGQMITSFIVPFFKEGWSWIYPLGG